MMSHREYGKEQMNDLVDVVTQGMMNNDETALFDLLPQEYSVGDLKPVLRTCNHVKDNPEEMERAARKFIKRFEDAQSKISRSLAQCKSLIPSWEGAIEIKRTGGGIRKRECDLVSSIKDVNVTYRLGDRLVNIRVDDPILINGRYYISDDPTCRVVRS